MGKIKSLSRKLRLSKKKKVRNAPRWADIKKFSLKRARSRRIRTNKKRGKLKIGYHADIVLLDMSNIKVMSDGLEPRRYPRGVEYVFVNGNKVVEKGKHTGAKPGKVILRE